MSQTTTAVTPDLKLENALYYEYRKHGINSGAFPGIHRKEPI